MYLDGLLFPLIPHYAGVFAADTIPRFRKSERVMFIVNLSAANERGTHFIAVHKTSRKVFVFDPLALVLTNLHILNQLIPYELPIILNERKVQADDSDFCGLYCAAHCLYNNVVEVGHIHFAQNFFSGTHLRMNDQLCIHLICGLLHVHVHPRASVNK